jgi:RNA recognition motif-containing protein
MSNLSETTPSSTSTSTSSPSPSPRLYLKNLPVSLTKQELVVLLSQFGTVRSAQLHNKHKSVGSALVTLSTQAEAESAIKALNGMTLRLGGELHTETLQVQYASAPVDLPSAKDCHYFKAGKCQRYNCMFSHGVEASAKSRPERTIATSAPSSSSASRRATGSLFTPTQTVYNDISALNANESPPPSYSQSILETCSQVVGDQPPVSTPTRCVTLFITNIHLDANDDDIRNICSAFGDVLDARIHRDSRTGVSLGFGYVKISDDSGAAMVMRFVNGMLLEGQPLVVAPISARAEPSAPSSTTMISSNRNSSIIDNRTTQTFINASAHYQKGRV